MVLAMWLAMSYTKYKQVWVLINQITAKSSSCGPFLAWRSPPGWALPSCQVGLAHPACSPALPSSL